MFEIGQEVTVNDAESAYNGRKAIVVRKSYYKTRSYDGFIYGVEIGNVSFSVREEHLI